MRLMSRRRCSAPWHGAPAASGNYVRCGWYLFLYVREPGGMRIELFSGGYMLYAPDIFPLEWKVSQGSLNAWNPSVMIPDGYLFDAFPPLAPAALKERALAGDYRV
jgi:catechol 2,3-dioxygenase